MPNFMLTGITKVRNLKQRYITIQQYELLLPLLTINIRLHKVVYHNNIIPYLKRVDLTLIIVLGIM